MWSVAWGDVWALLHLLCSSLGWLSCGCVLCIRSAGCWIPELLSVRVYRAALEVLGLEGKGCREAASYVLSCISYETCLRFCMLFCMHSSAAGCCMDRVQGTASMPRCCCDQLLLLYTNAPAVSQQCCTFIMLGAMRCTCQTASVLGQV